MSSHPYRARVSYRHCLSRIIPVLVAAACLSGCTFHSRAQQFHGLPGPNAQPIEYMSTTKLGLNLLFVLPLFGDTSLDSTVASLTEEAKANGAKNVDLVQSTGSTYWYVFPPLSFFIHPVTSDVTAMVELSPPTGFPAPTPTNTDESP